MGIALLEQPPGQARPRSLRGRSSQSLSPPFSGPPTLGHDDADLSIHGHSVSDPGFIRQVTSALMQACILRRWDPQADESMQDMLPPQIVAALSLPAENHHAMGMTAALLAITDLQERKRVLCDMILSLASLR